jgi:hypothetical protein
MLTGMGNGSSSENESTRRSSKREGRGKKSIRKGLSRRTVVGNEVAVEGVGFYAVDDTNHQPLSGHVLRFRLSWVFRMN